MYEDDFVIFIIIGVGNRVLLWRQVLLLPLPLLLLVVELVLFQLLSVVLLATLLLDEVVLLKLLVELLAASSLVSSCVKISMAVEGVLPLSFVYLATEVLLDVEVLLAAVGLGEVVSLSTWSVRSEEEILVGSTMRGVPNLRAENCTDEES